MGADGIARPLVEVRAVSKRFGGVQAVSNVSLAIRLGGVHGLVGENGAGKSTLSKIIGGVHQPDEGELAVDGKPVRFRSPRDALAAGIATIAQELALVPARSVVENVFLGVEAARLGVVPTQELRRRFDELNERTGFALPADARAGDLRTAEQQKVEILRAIARDARLILMDEPTASLTADETGRLLQIIRRLSAAGTAVVLVSHFLDEVLAVSDEVTIMRDGRLVRTAPASQETEESLVAAMIGRNVELAFPERGPVPAGAPTVLEARGLSRQGAIDDVSLTLRAGEIVGLAGLVGSGRTEVARALFGADRLDAGTILIDGRPVRIRSPRDAARAGIAMLPESRKDQGLFMLRSIRENASIADLARLAPGGVVDTRRERHVTRVVATEVDVRTRSIEASVATLSGGNQQKVLFAKWLVRRPRVLLADEPTRGVDVGAKRQIHELLVRLAEQGMGVLLISSEIEEVLGLAHRILVLRAGQVVAEFAGPEATKETVMSAAFQSARTVKGGATR
ncbi:MAG: sugar ABC transporter ATP-binding protein [Chloroflexota bacterium]|nr:sugar ABC transporter ATP-binding protein [Chloroflexota bacterium]